MQPDSAHAGWMSAGEIAAVFRVEPDALRKRLERFRAEPANDRAWIEVADPFSHSPRYLYRLSHVRSFIRPPLADSDDFLPKNPASDEASGVQ